MSIFFFTDPHLGLMRSSHTTPASRERLKNRMFEAAQIACGFADQGPLVCGGDLFDKATNDEATIRQALQVAGDCALILGGNHDSVNRDGKSSSLDIIQDVFPAQVVSDVLYEDRTAEGWHIYSVPHQRTQQEFIDMLETFVTGPTPVAAQRNLLLLHCNYDNGLADDEATLNLPRDLAEKLLGRFDFIVLGHEHIPRTDLDGRVRVLGNLHPTSFSDISDKFVWELTPDGEWKSHLIWEAETSVRVEWGYLLNPTFTSGGNTYAVTKVNWQDVDFIDVVGNAPADRAPAISKAIYDLWRNSDALMIRNNVEYEQIQVTADEQVKGLRSLPAIIQADLQGSDLLPLWEEFAGRVSACRMD